MAGVYKRNCAAWRSMTVVDRRALDEFPEEEKVRYALDIEAEEQIVEEEPLDPEAIRAAVFEEAREEAERLVQEAYAEGYRRGEEAGREAFEARVADSVAVFDNAAGAIKEAHQFFLQNLEPEALALCAAIAERVIQRELCMDKELVREVVARALARMADHSRLVIKVNPEDLENIQDFQEVITSRLSDCIDVKVMADPAVSRGGCLIDSPSEQADARMETMLGEIVSALEF